MHARLKANLCPSIIQRVTGGVPSRTITAPDTLETIRTMLSEAERQAQFAYSENCHKRGARYNFTYED